jgi:PAS domain S-box-containing protein
MKRILNIIIVSLLIFCALGSADLKSQTISYNEQKVIKTFAIINKLVWPLDDIKTEFVIGIYGCSKDFENMLNRHKPNKFFGGVGFKVQDFNPYNGTLGFDVIFVDESKNFELEKIYNILLSDAKGGASVLLISNGWTNQEKLVVNFFIEKSGEFVNFEFSVENLDKFNISATKEFSDLNGINLSTKKLLDKAKIELQEAEKELKRKEDELKVIAAEVKDQQAKINNQKGQLTEQQRLIEEKQLELTRQQNKLQSVTAEMYVAQQKLIRQQASFEIKEKLLIEKQDAINEYENRINLMQTQFEEQTKIIKQKEQEVNEVIKQIDEKKKELGDLNDIITLQRYALIAFGFLLAIIIILAFWILRNYRKMKHQNIVLEHQKNEIQAQAEELEKANLELEKLSIVASNTNNAVCILDKNSNFEWLNAGFTKLYGYTLQLLKNEQDPNIKKVSLYKGVVSILDKVFEQKVSFNFEHECLSRAGQAYWIQTNITPILNYHNEVKQIVLVDTDISIIKEAEQQIAAQNKNIKNSILYASRIQKATLPTTRILLSYLPDSFVLYLPRDIVSGDFYWSAKIDSKIFFAAADCTGHGVPGAFMSMLGVTLLNEIVTKIDYNELKPNAVLDNLREKLIISLRQSESEESTTDGIDLALCMVENNIKKLSYSGAQNEMVIIRNGVLTDYPADDMPIGYSSNMNKSFSLTEIDFQENDLIYIFSDGYVDQFGGPGERKKKFFIKRLRDLFLEISPLPMGEQKDILLQTHLDFRGETKQMDDILIMGVKF